MEQGQMVLSLRLVLIPGISLSSRASPLKDMAEWHLDQRRKLASQGRRDEPIEEHSSAIALDPNHAEAPIPERVKRLRRMSTVTTKG